MKAARPEQKAGGVMGWRGLLVAALVGWGAASELGAQTLQTILTNGPASNRFNVVFLSEGYTAAQLPAFLGDVTNAASALLNRSPFAEYRSYFNVYAISVASVQTGSDHPAYGSYRTTYFNSSYDAQSDYLITIPPNAFDTNSAHGQGKVDALLQSLVPNCRLAVLLVNDVTQGGSDGLDKTAITYTGAGLTDILLHEIGHVMANLGDEYTNANPGFPNTEEPNTTQQTNPSLIKWRAWIPAGVPIPTPASYSSVVGLFQGAHYHVSGWYRPKYDCTMNHPSTPDFCEVCSEALLLSVYRKVRPVDGFSPSSKSISLTNGQALEFAVQTLTPSAHALSVQWFTNQTPVAGATQASFLLLPGTLANGSHVLSAVVTDPTALVRTDPSGWLSQTNTWNLSLDVPELRLDPPLLLSAGALAFRISGYAPQGFVVQASTDLVGWSPLWTNTLVGGQYWYTDSVPAFESRKFFRVKAR